MKKYVNKNLYD